MKRMEKQREKAERRAQKRLANRTQNELPAVLRQNLIRSDLDRGVTSGASSCP
jgi:hypothetical protein